VSREVLDTHRKALSINLDKGQYGTIAEIGAGQETARWFFQVGGAAGTIAKAISAYDMTFSDSIYGPAPRYVSRERLQAMVAHEYRLVTERLGGKRGAESMFFAFANTVAARSFSRQQDGQGWMGIRFQAEPLAEPSQIDIHVHLLGSDHLQDQETLGVLGVNLIYGALHYAGEPELLLQSLRDNLPANRVEVDLVDFSGPAFSGLDNRLMTLRLVQHGLTHAAMFTADGRAANPADTLYKRAVLVERSRFRPPTHLTMDLLDCAQQAFAGEPEVAPSEVLVLSEMTLHNLVDGGDIDVQDFLHRADILCALGKNVLVSNLGEFYRLAAYLFRYTQRPIGVVMGIPTLAEIFNEKYYDHLAGGILESFGRMFKNDLRLYVCPAQELASGKLMDADNFRPPENLRHLYAYLHENGFIRGLDGIEMRHLAIHSHEVLNKIRTGEPGWDEMVPETVARMIREQQLFGCRG
jgi:hypothetical protein